MQNISQFSVKQRSNFSESNISKANNPSAKPIWECAQWGQCSCYVEFAGQLQYMYALGNTIKGIYCIKPG